MSPIDAPPSLRIAGVRKAFPGVVAVAGADLEVHGGEILALVGEIGAPQVVCCPIGTPVRDLLALAGPSTPEAVVTRVRRPTPS